MSTPNNDESSFLHQLQEQVEEELAEDESAMPAEDAEGISTEAWQLDPYLPRYEVGLQALLGAVEVREDDPARNDLPAQDATLRTEEGQSPGPDPEREDGGEAARGS